MATSQMQVHKVGDSFTRLFVVPPEFADGYFVGWVVTSQIRDQDGALVADSECTWLDQVTTRNLKLRVANTAAWSQWAGQVVSTDIQFVRTADGEVMSTTTASFKIVKDVTQP